MKFYFVQDCQFRENLLDHTKIEWHFIKTFTLILFNSFKPNHVCCGHNIRKIKATCLEIAFSNAQNDIFSLGKTTETETFVSSLPFME